MRHFRYPFSSWSLADVIFVDFGNDGAGTWYIRKEDADSLPLKMVLAIGKETWSQHRLCVDRTTSLCMVVSGHGHMRSGGQSSNYAEAMVSNGVVV